MNHLNAAGPQRMKNLWPAKPGPVTVAMIGDEETIEHTQDLVKFGGVNPTPGPEVKLLEMKTLSQPEKPGKLKTTAKFLAKTTLGLGLALAGGAALVGAGSIAAGFAGALGITGGAIAGSAVMGVGIAKKKPILAALGGTAMAGALAVTGSALAGGVFGVGLLGLGTLGVGLASRKAGQLLKGRESLDQMREAWKS